MRAWCLVTCLLALSACGGRAPAPTPAPAPAPVADRLALVPGQGRILAETAGGTVALTLADGTTVPLADGELVTLREQAVAPDSPVAIIAGGREGTVPGVHVIADALALSPDGKWGVARTGYTCGDFCYGHFWVLGADGRRLHVTDSGSANADVAWRADGGAVAIGAGPLHVVAIPALQVATHEDLTAPAYAPDGVLFARGNAGSDAVHAIAADGTRRVVFTEPGEPPQPDPGEGDDGTPSPVSFDGPYIVAEFSRGDAITRRFDAQGKPAAP